MPAAAQSDRRSAADTRPEPRILFQSYFKNAANRTYAAQVKEAANGSQFLVLTEGRRDRKTNELKKFSLCVFSEDFPAFFRLVKEAAEYVKSHSAPQPSRRPAGKTAKSAN